MSPSVTLWDDGSPSYGWPVPFDAEGVPCQRVEIITRGVVNTPVHNLYTAGKEGTVRSVLIGTWPTRSGWCISTSNAV